MEPFTFFMLIAAFVRVASSEEMRKNAKEAVKIVIDIAGVLRN